jgi:DNA polymerase III delta subunit
VNRWLTIQGELKQLLTQFSELRREIEKLGLIWTEKARPTVNNVSNLMEQMTSVAALLNLQTRRNAME